MSRMKNMFSVINAVDAGYHVSFGVEDVMFLRNTSSLKVDVVLTRQQVKDLYVLSASAYMSAR